MLDHSTTTLRQIRLSIIASSMDSFFRRTSLPAPFRKAHQVGNKEYVTTAVTALHACHGTGVGMVGSHMMNLTSRQHAYAAGTHV